MHTTTCMNLRVPEIYTIAPLWRDAYVLHFVLQKLTAYRLNISLRMGCNRILKSPSTWKAPCEMITKSPKSEQCIRSSLYRFHSRHRWITRTVKFMSSWHAVCSESSPFTKLNFSHTAQMVHSILCQRVKLNTRGRQCQSTCYVTEKDGLN